MASKLRDIQDLLNRYYAVQLNQQNSKLNCGISWSKLNILEKLRFKTRTFREHLQQSDQADGIGNS